MYSAVVQCFMKSVCGVSCPLCPLCGNRVMFIPGESRVLQYLQSISLLWQNSVGWLQRAVKWRTVDTSVDGRDSLAVACYFKTGFGLVDFSPPGHIFSACE